MRLITTALAGALALGGLVLAASPAEARGPHHRHGHYHAPPPPHHGWRAPYRPYHAAPRRWYPPRPAYYGRPPGYYAPQAYYAQPSIGFGITIR